VCHADQDRSAGYDLQFVFSGAGGLRAEFFRAQGLDPSLVLMSPADKAYQALKAGEVDFVAAEAQPSSRAGTVSNSSAHRRRACTGFW
jgi:hypothetical protein